METKAKFLEEITSINKNYDTELIGRAFERPEAARRTAP